MQFTKTLRSVAEHKLATARRNKMLYTELIAEGKDPYGFLLMESSLLRIEIETIEKWLSDNRADF